MKNPTADPLKVGIVGAGAMGQGIVQVTLTGGMQAVIYDAKPGGGEAGRDQVFARLDRLVEKGSLEDTEAAALKQSVAIAGGLADLADCDVVVEAVFEDADLKRQIFADLEAVVSDGCVLASNTSSILIASIARECKIKARVAGMHFFNPVPLMKLVEVVQGADTSEDTITFLRALGERMGRTPVTVRDAPGCLVNLGGRAYTTEAMRLVHERVATPTQIDAIMRDCCGFRLGPLQLADLTGVDVNYPVSQIIYQGYDQDPRLKTSFPHLSLLEAGRLGRKSGLGNYRYEGGKPVDVPSPDHVTQAAPAKSVMLVEPGEKLEAFAAEIGWALLEEDDGESPLIGFPLGEDATAFAVWTGADPARLICVDLSVETHSRVTLMAAPGAGPAIIDAVAASLTTPARPVTLIKDSPGFVAQRIRGMVANLGCEMAQIGVASPGEIDLAMKLGLNYPQGPLELAEEMGLDDTLTIMETLQSITGDDRYRPSQWLRRRALLGLPIDTAD
ncbi:MAG: 3-hydroxyacyl-CoA dehydrogenase [Alphaproteobacteria bacterium]|nr:3-hydroxyacyl-CoA dehydrogenase [Alphaproteobacteria bacterium]